MLPVAGGLKTPDRGRLAERLIAPIFKLAIRKGS